MTERYAAFAAFNSKEVCEALAAESQPVRDVAHGAGSVLHIADGKTSLEVFPAAGVARVTTNHARLEVHRVPAYAVDAQKHRVVFDQGADDDRTRLMIRDDGKVSFYPVLRSVRAPETARPAETDATVAVTASPPPGRPTTPEKHTGESGSESTEPEVVTLQGRLGRDPWFSSDEDSLVAKFPLAVNVDDKTTWHKVVVFDAVAQDLQEQANKGDVRKGRLVDVTGQTVTLEEESARGNRKTAEFHATRVARVRATRAR